MIRSLVAALALLLAAPAFAADAPTPAAPPAPPPPAQPFVYVPKANDIVIGKKDAPVTIVEYASLSCPHCAHFYTENLPPVQQKYIDTGKAKLVYRDFPLNDPALKGAMLVQCAPATMRESFLKVLFSTQGKWAYDGGYKESLAGIAAVGGVDRATFDACMKNDTLKDSILATAKEAETDYRVGSTPTFFVGGKKEEGAIDPQALGKDIDVALAAAKK